MLDKSARFGNFSSSEIVALTTLNKKGDDFGAPAKTYIAEKRMERRLQRSLDTENKARPTLWGKFLESFVFDELPLGYSYNSDETLIHPEYPFWVGTPDGFKYDEGKTVVDSKCPYTLKSFCQLVQPLYDGLTGMQAMNALRFGYISPDGTEVEKHKDGEKFFQQLVSNAILSKSKYAELIIYCPYESQLSQIKSLAEGQSDYYFIWAANDEELPYLKDGGYYKSLNIIRFEVPQEDKALLNTVVPKAEKLLNPSILLAEQKEGLIK